MAATIGYVLKMKRMALGKSQAEIASLLGYSKKTISKAERNLLSENADSVKKLKEYYEKNIKR